MDNVTEFIKFLKSRQSFQARKALLAENSNTPDAASKHLETSAKYTAILSWLESIEKEQPQSATSATVTDKDLFSLNPLNMQDIPDDLSDQLSVSQSDTEDAQVLELLNIAGRPLDLNELLIGCYRKYDVKHKRNQLTARIYRLIKRDLAHSVGKGTYALGPDSHENKAPPNEKFDPLKDD